MSVDATTGTHFPSKSMLFEFDDEVISIFDNMSKRSIVGYENAYRMIANFAASHAWPEDGCEVWDFGTTIGKALTTIRGSMPISPYIDYHGLDISEASVLKTREALPWAKIHQHDLTNRLFPEDYEPLFPVHMMVFGYTLQFIKDMDARRLLIREAFMNLAPGGMLFVMEKYNFRNARMNKVAQDAYIQFRRDNGYTLEEIMRKGQALANAMWPASPEFMEECMREAGFEEVHCLYRELNFGGFVAIKGH